MKKNIVLLTFLHCWVLVTPSFTPADEVSKNFVILQERRDIKDFNGILAGRESIYSGGISGNPSDKNGQNLNTGITLREFRPPAGSFTFFKGDTSLTATVIPLVSREHHGLRIPAIGNWQFKTTEANSYESVIHVKKGGDLDIVYQSTGMRMDDKEHVLHYGLSGNPHAVTLSRMRLKSAFASSNTSTGSQPILNYQPADDIILVQMEFTPKGFLVRPIFDYQVVKQ